MDHIHQPDEPMGGRIAMHFRNLDLNLLVALDALLLERNITLAGSTPQSVGHEQRSVPLAGVLR